MTEAQIATRLNGAGTAAEGGGPWTRGLVHGVLTNEKYIGNNLYNRTSFKLKQMHVLNAPELWVRKEGAFDALVEKQVFYTAQGIILGRHRRLSNEDLIDRLRTLFHQTGYLSGIVINESEGTPSASAYISRFGSLIRAYSLVGFHPQRDYQYIEVNKVLRRMHPDIVNRTIEEIAARHGRVRRDEDTDLLTINDEFTVSMVLSRCRVAPNGKYSWSVRMDTSLDPDVTVAVRFDHSNESPLDYYLLPRIDVAQLTLQLKQANKVELDGYRFDNLEYLYQLGAQVHVRKVA